MIGKSLWARWEVGMGRSPASLLSFPFPAFPSRFRHSSPLPLNYQPTRSRYHDRGLGRRESSYIGLCFRLWKWLQVGLYWRKSNQQTCSQATDWSVTPTETRRRMANFTTSPQRALYLGELSVMRCGVLNKCFYEIPPRKCVS